MGLVEGEGQEFDFSEVEEIKECGKNEANKLLKTPGWRLLSVATTREGGFNYSVGRVA